MGEMKAIETQVKNCRECPFANNDNEYGFDMCNAPDVKPILSTDEWEELPETGVHKNCPLKENVIIVKLNGEFWEK